MMVKYPKVIRHGNETWDILASNDLGLEVFDRLRVVDDIFFNAKGRKGKRKGSQRKVYEVVELTLV
jgi:hypothetical protein